MYAVPLKNEVETLKIYDLSKELFSAAVFPGDPEPAKRPFAEISETCPYNLTVLTFGSHNGTHMDAPKHFVAGGRDIAEVALEKCVGSCKVTAHSGFLTAADARRMLEDGTKRLLIRGEIEITPEAAEAFAAGGLWFLGVEGMTVGGKTTGVAVHRALLGAEIVILEAAVLTGIEAGEYFLSSAPLKMQGLDGSPCRPLLIALETGGEK